MQLGDFINQLKTGLGTDNGMKLSQMNTQPLIDSLNNFTNAILSNMDQGWTRTRNRRAQIYEKMINRHMRQDWDIEKSGNYFTLTRKNEF